MSEKEKTVREKALDLFLKHSGDITNRAIAKELNANEKTIGTWKSRDKWKEKLKRSTKAENKSTSKKVGLRDRQRERIIDALKVANSYSPALDLLVDVYLDCYEEYEYAKKNELETSALRKELAKLLRDLGLDTNNRNMTIKKVDKKEEKKEEQPGNKLLQFRRQVNK